MVSWSFLVSARNAGSFIVAMKASRSATRRSAGMLGGAM